MSSARINGDYLRERREAKGYSRERLALLANVSARAISNYERESPIRTSPHSWESLAFIAEALEVPLDALVIRESGPSLMELERQLNTAIKTEDRRLEATTALSISRISYEIGSYQEAKLYAKKSQSIFQEQEDDVNSFYCDIILADISMAHGKYNGIEARLVPIYESKIRGPQRADAALSIGWALALQGIYSRAIEWLEKASDYYYKTHMSGYYARTLRRIHWVNLRLGRYELSREYAEKARCVFYRLGDRYGEARALMGIGQAFLADGEHPFNEKKLNLALKNLKKAQRLAEDEGDRHIYAEIEWLQGTVFHRLSRTKDAQKALEHALNTVIDPQIADKDDEMRILIELARVMITLNQPKNAIKMADKSIILATEINSTEGMAMAFIERSTANLLLSQNTEASTDASKALEFVDKCEYNERWRAQDLISAIDRSDRTSPRS